MARIDSFLKLVADQHASDLHFTSGAVPLIRHDGELVRLPFRVLSEADAKSFLLEILTPEQSEMLRDRQEIDFVYAIDGLARYRVNVFHKVGGPGAVFRVIANKVPTMEELNLPPSVRRFAELQNGLVLVCGPTGSGKTSTLAALIHAINHDAARPRHIITVEDPIEFIHEPVHGVISQRQLGLHTEGFASAIRSSLRESPDVLVVGEMRDYETISLALSAAETGVLVFGTLHTNSAAKAVDRMIDAFPDEIRDQMRSVISVLLKGVVSQHLIKRASGDGRVAVCEVLIPNIAVANMIRENKIHQIESYLSSADQDESGAQSLDGAIFRALREQLITLEEAARTAQDPERLRQRAAELPKEE